jgi:hypothetical protein
LSERVTIVDPAGFAHVVEVYAGQLYGHENLAQALDAHPSQRHALCVQLAVLAFQGKALPAGFYVK